MFPNEYDPTEHLGEVIPSCDPEAMKRSPSPNDGAVYVRLSLLNLMLHHGEYAKYQDRWPELVPLFATFPFRIAEVLPDGSWRLDGDGFGEEIQKALAKVS